MKRLIFGLLFAIFGVSAAFAACPAGTYYTTNDTNCIFVSPTSPLPIGTAFTQTARAPDLTATNATGSVALGASASVARVCNTSSSVNAYVALGDSTVTVTTSNGILVPAGQCANLNLGTATYLAGITSASSAVLQTSIGSGLASLGGGGSGSGGGTGTVTSVAVTTQNGVSAVVTNPTTTPALAFSLGTISPSTVTIGAGSAITSSGAGGALGALSYTVPGTGVATALGNTAGGTGGFALQSSIVQTGSVLTACLFDFDVSTTGTETQFSLTLPTNITRWRLGTTVAIAKSGTAWASASIALYSGASAGGVGIIGPTALTSLTTTAVNTSGALQAFNAGSTTFFLNFTSLYLRTTTGSGQAVGGTLIDFCMTILPLPSS